MHYSVSQRLISLLFVLIGVLCINESSALAQAPAPNLIVQGGAPAPCGATGPRAPTVEQATQPLSFSLRNFPPGLGNVVTVTLPDGRVFGPGAEAMALDGVIDLPASALTLLTVAGNADTFANYPTNNNWPIGCYTLTVSTPMLPGVPPVRASGKFVLTEPVARVNPGGLRLTAVNSVTRQASGVQAVAGPLVEISGRIFPAPIGPIGLTVRQPNGTVLTLPPAVAPNGGFTALFPLTANNQLGIYTFIATVVPPSGAGTPPLRATAQFQLLAQNLPAVGNARLDVLDPLARAVPQGNLPTILAALAPSTVQIEGHQFPAGAAAIVRVLKPNGAALPLEVYVGLLPLGSFPLPPLPLFPAVNANGDISLVLPFSRQLPTGEYTIIVETTPLPGAPVATRAVTRVRLVAP